MRPDYPISYAGLDSKTLWENAKRAFDHGQHPVPTRLRDFLPLFPMELTVSMRFLGLGAPMAAPSGFSTDPDEYHAALSAALPKLYQDENRQRCFDYEGRFRGGEVRVDAAWARMFPQYAPFLGERLIVRLIGGGCEAAAVPQSLCLRCAELLDGAEREMGVTARAEDYIAYVHARLSREDHYDSAGFARDYLRTARLTCAVVRQADLSQAMQDEAIVRSLSRERGCRDELFTDTASRVGVVRQYQPFARACDFFSEETVNRHTARLVQLCWSGDDRVDNLWLVYEDARAYMNRTRRVVDARALCEGFQLAPVPTAGGAAYPDSLRVAVVRSHDARLWVARTLNNPAYGSGLSPQGTLNRLVWLEDSEGMLRRHQLALENELLPCTNTEADAQTWERMARQARAQERKGRLIDTLYRRERALHRLAGDALASGRALLMLDERIAGLEKRLAAGGADEPGGEYDADLAYLRRKARAQAGELEPDEPPFAPDKKRERSIECGYAMRAAQVPDEGWEPDPEPMPQEEAPEAAAEEEAPEDAPWPDEWDEMLATFAEVEARMRAAGSGEAASEEAVNGECADAEADGRGNESAQAASIEATSADSANMEPSCEALANADSMNTEPADEAPANAEAEQYDEQDDETTYESPASVEVEQDDEPARGEFQPSEPTNEVAASEEPVNSGYADAEADGSENESAQAASIEATSADSANMEPSCEALANADSMNTEPTDEAPANAEVVQYDEQDDEPTYESPASVEVEQDDESANEEAGSEEAANDEYADAEPDVSESAQAAIIEATYTDSANMEPSCEALASADSTNTDPADESPASAEAEQDDEPTHEEFHPSEPASEVAASEVAASEEPADESPASAEAERDDEPTHGEFQPSEPTNEEPASEEPASDESANDEPANDESATAEPDVIGNESAHPASIEATSADSTNTEPACESSMGEEPAASEHPAAEVAAPLTNPTVPPPAARPPMVSTTPPPNHPAVPPQPRRIRGKKARHRKARERQMRFEQIGMFVKPAPASLPELGDPPPAAPAPAAPSEAEAPAPYAPRAMSDVAPEADAHHPRSMAELFTPPQS